MHHEDMECFWMAMKENENIVLEKGVSRDRSQVSTLEKNLETGLEGGTMPYAVWCWMDEGWMGEVKKTKGKVTIMIIARI